MNKTRYALLGLLAERPCSGYELKQVVGQRFALFWKESYGQIYPELRRLVTEGLAEAGPPGTRGKTEYQITASGRQALADWVAAPADDDQVRSELLLKLYFAAWNPPQREGHLAEVRARADRNLRWLRAAQAELESILDDDPTHVHALSIVRLGIATQTAHRDWAASELQEPTTSGQPQ